MTFKAKYPGRCPACHERIEPGDDVRFEDLDVVHADCADIIPDLEPAPTCPKCWLLKPCECEDDT